MSLNRLHRNHLRALERRTKAAGLSTIFRLADARGYACKAGPVARELD